MNSNRLTRTALVLKANILILIYFLAFLPFSVKAQKANVSNSSQETVTITVNNIAINGELSFDGLIANFPNPVLSTISIFDSNGDIITGLADSSRWLGPDDMAEIGLLISEIWQPIVEYHLEDPSIPSDPNLYNQIPSPLFMEVRNNTPIPTSTMLVMDVSTSMRQEIEDAKDGVRLFVDLLRPQDQAGIIQFSDTIKVNQGLTDDKEQLYKIIDSTEISDGTAVYDGIMGAIDELKTESDRSGVVVYTDGGDNNSDNTPEAVIDSASAYNIPVFAIALGNDTNEDTLMQIASQTGGKFFKAATAEEMKEIFVKLSKLTQNYYVMAHTSSDPENNDTWRVVDISVNTPDFIGNGSGQYFVKGTNPIMPADISVDLTSVTDTTILVGDDTFNAVQFGETYEYLINVKNDGPNHAYTVKLNFVLPDSLSFIDATIPPLYTNQDSIVWEFKAIERGKEINIALEVQLAQEIPSGLTDLASLVNVTALNDNTLDNNSAADTVHIIFPKDYDLALTQQAITDTFLVLNDDTVQAVFLGDSYSYSLTIDNLGPLTAHNILLWDILPDSVTASNFNYTPVKQVLDTLFWQFDSMEAGSNINVSFDVVVSKYLPYTPFPLNNISRIFAEYDTLADNNFTNTAVYAMERKTDVAVKITSITDSTEIENSGPVNVVRPGDMYQYQIELQNLGNNQAENTRLVQMLPDSVHLIEATIQPAFANKDSLVWILGDVEQESETTIMVSVQLAPKIFLSLKELYSNVNLSADNDTLLTNNFDSDTVRVIFDVPDQSGTCDLSLSQKVFTDTMIVIDGDSIPAVLNGGNYKYNLNIRNFGPGIAHDFTVWDVYPGSVTCSNFNISPTTQTKDTLFWQFDSLTRKESITISWDATVTDSIPFGHSPLINKSRVIAEQDTLLENNIAVDTVIAIRPRSRFCDLSLSQKVSTETFFELDGDSKQAAFWGDNYSYSLKIENLGPATAHNFTLRDVFPDSVTVSDFNIEPTTQVRDTLFWQFDSLKKDNSITISFSATVADSIPVSPFALINSSRVIAVYDTLPGNDSAIDTVFAIHPKLKICDLSLSQQAATDTSLVLDGDSKPAVLWGDAYSYSLKIKNLGPETAHNFTLWDVIPDSVNVSDFNIEPNTQVRDTLFWQFDSLKKDNSITISFRATVADSIPVSPFALINSSRVIAIYDTLPGNDSAIDTVFAIRPKLKICDLAISQQVATDTSIILDEDSKPAVYWGDSYSYSLKIENFGPETAHNLTLWDVFPDSVTVSDFSTVPTTQLNDTLFWRFDSLANGNIVTISFMASVADSFPYEPFLLENRAQIFAKNDTLPENNFTSNQVYAIEDPDYKLTTDVSIKQSATTEAFSVIKGDTLRSADAGETYSYTITITNEKFVKTKNVTVINILPDTVSADNFQPPPDLITPDSIIWKISLLEPKASLTFKFDATVSPNMPEGENLLLNKASVTARNEDENLLSDNSSIDTVYNYVGPLLPFIEATPEKIDIGGEISVLVLVEESISSWDIWVYLENGEIDKTYADNYISSTQLTPDELYPIDVDKDVKKRYSRLITHKKQEQVIFELRTTNLFGKLRTAQASVIVQSNNNLNLERNVFLPGREGEITINFKLSSNRDARLDLYDIAGTKITKITEGPYNAGWNEYSWNGITDNGQKIGSGLYLVTISSGGYTDWKKVMIVR